VEFLSVKRWLIHGLLSGLMVCGLGGAGCQVRPRFEPPIDPASLDSLEFVHALAQQPMVNFDQVCRAVLLVGDGQEQFGTFEDRQAELNRRGWVKRAWGLSPDDALDRGTLAYMVFRMCGLGPGINAVLSRVTGLGDRRAALKSVVRHGMMSYGDVDDYPTGGEVMSALSRADDYLARKGVYEGPADVSAPGSGG